MKKLMIAAAATAVAGGVFGATAVSQDPLVYDYLATVTHMYDKLVKVTDVASGETVNVYQKSSKTSTIKGYLIQDQWGATSQKLGGSNAWVYDQGRNRGFLVVYNSGAEADVRAPKIIPAVLEAKRLDTKFKNDKAGAYLQEGIAEGMLFAGGDLMADGNLMTPGTTNGWNYITQVYPADIQAGVRMKLDNGNNFLDPTKPAAPQLLQPAFYADYAWTSIYLFGEYNGPQFAGLWQNAQLDIDAKQRIITGNSFYGTGLAGEAFYHDTWLNHAGIGTYKQLKGSAAAICCGLSAGAQAGKFVLESLSGNFKGGIFLCSDNGFEQNQVSGIYAWFKGVWWEDQFFSAGAGIDAADAKRGTNAVWYVAGDYDQADVWTDGDIEVNTTDVAYGTWSIQRTTALTGVAWTSDEIAALATLDTTVNPKGYTAKNALLKLTAAIKGAANKLAGTTPYNFYLDKDFDGIGDEIHNVNVADDYADRFVVPFLTPKFVWAYGLAGFVGK